MARKRSYLPQSTAGLVRYFEEAEGKIKIGPQHVIAVCVAIIILELMLIFLY